MTKAVVCPAGSAPPLAPYSPGIAADGVLYVSGMLAMDAQGNTVGVGDVRAQARCVLDSVQAVVQAAGGSMADVVYNMIFLKDLADYPAFNEVYGTYFASRPPARFCIRADLVKPEFLVEVTSIAHVGA